jgi:hypothetical protein
MKNNLSANLLLFSFLIKLQALLQRDASPPILLTSHIEQERASV